MSGKEKKTKNKKIRRKENKNKNKGNKTKRKTKEKYKEDILTWKAGTRHGGSSRGNHGWESEHVTHKDGNGYPKPEYPMGFTR